jgi:predicted permease
MNKVLDDVGYAVRKLSKSPGFAFTVLLTLAVGIGATTAIFTLVYDVLLKPLPYSHAEQLVVMEEQVAEFRDIYPTLPINANHFTFWSQNAHSVQSMVVMQESSMPLGGGTRPLRIGVLSTTPGIFRVLDSSPLLGRAFSQQEAQPGHEHVVILMDKLWHQQYGSDPAILGKTVLLNGFTYTVIGVMGPSFHLPVLETFASADSAPSQPAEALVPLAFTAEQLQEKMGDFNYFGLARLQPGASASQASAEMNALQASIMRGLAADEKATLSAVINPLQQALVGSNRTPLLLLLCAVAGLLLVGCVNITNLLLGRAAGQRQPLAVAAALGASRAEILHMAMRETLVLAALGGALGLILASVIIPAMQRYLPPALDFRGQLHLDWTGAAFALSLALFATLLAGAAPAWRAAQTGPHEILQSEARLGSESSGSKRLRRILVGSEVAVSMALILMTGLLTTSLFRLLHVDRGFEASHIVTATLNLPQKSYSDKKARAAFFKEATGRLTQLPGVESAAAVSVLPLTGDSWIDMIQIPGDTRPAMQIPSEHFRWITPSYFDVIHLPLVAGRFLQPGDEGKNYAVISELTARTLWPGRDPIGQQFHRGGQNETAFTIIGVAANARTVSLSKPDPMMVYMPYWYRSDESAGLLVRTRQDSSAIADAIRKSIWSVDPEVPVPVVRTLSGVVTDSLANRRFEMDLLLLFAVSAMFLAGLGVFGVVNYSVVQRQRELGLRLALGAQRGNIYRLVLVDGLSPVVVGGVAGIAVAFGFARVLQSLLFQVSAYNAAIISSSVCLLIIVGVAACLLPARRAASTDPMQALKRE